MRTPASFQLFLLVGSCLVLSGCTSFRFDREWSRLAATPADSERLEGLWQGTWLSDQNGHKGGLRCIVSKSDTPEPGAEETYQFRFLASYASLFKFERSVTMRVTRGAVGASESGFSFHGEEDLGWWGVFKYEGKATGPGFHSTYRSSSGDHGVFEMKRHELASDRGTPESAD